MTDDLARLSSPEGAVIAVKNPLSRFDSFKSVRALANANSALRTGALRSDCNLALMAMAARTDQVKWWKTPYQNAVALKLLSLKGIIESGGRGALYVVRYGELCGIQQGDPTTAPYEVKLDLFDRADRHYEMTLDAGRDLALTQTAVNAIIASLRPIAHN